MDGILKNYFAAVAAALLAFSTSVTLAEEPKEPAGVVIITDRDEQPAPTPGVGRCPPDPPPVQPARYTLPRKLPPVENPSFQRRGDRATTESVKLVQPAWWIPAGGDDGQTLEPASHAGATNEIQQAHLEAAVETRAMQLVVEARRLAVRAKTVGDYTDVIDQCVRAADAKPDVPTAETIAKLGAWAYNRRGELRTTAGDEHQAFDDFQEALLLDDECWEAFHNRGVTLARYGKLELALNDFERVVELAPGFAIGRFNRAEVYNQLGRWKAAVDDYDVVQSRLPDEPNLYISRAGALHQLGKTSDAVRDFNRAIAIDERLAPAFTGRGNVYADLGLYQQAASDFNQSLKLDPRSSETYRSVAWLLATCPDEEYRNPSKALEAAKRAKQLSETEDTELLSILAAAHAAAGEFREAVAYEQQALVLADKPAQREHRERVALYRQGQAYHTPVVK